MLRQNCLNKGIVMPRYNNKIIYQESILLPLYNRFIENSIRDIPKNTIVQALQPKSMLQ